MGRLITVHLHGRLARHGASYTLDISSPLEAVHALATQLPELERDLLNGFYRIVKGEDLETGLADQGLDMLRLRMGRITELHLVPAVEGAGKGGGIFKVILGVALIAAAVFLAPPIVGAMGPTLGMGTTAFTVFGASVTFGNIAMFGLTMALSGVMEMSSPVPKASAFQPASAGGRTEERPSFLYGGPLGTGNEGEVINLVYGRRVLVERLNDKTVDQGLSLEEFTGTGENDFDQRFVKSNFTKTVNGASWDYSFEYELRARRSRTVIDPDSGAEVSETEPLVHTVQLIGGPLPAAPVVLEEWIASPDEVLTGSWSSPADATNYRMVWVKLLDASGELIQYRELNIDQTVPMS